MINDTDNNLSVSDANKDTNQNNQDTCLGKNEATPHVQENYEILLKNSNEKIIQLENDLAKKDAELLDHKERMSQLEKEVSEYQKFKVQHQKDAEEVEELKNKSEETLTKAKSIIFEQTKLAKNRELQIETLNQQIDSLKDVVAITKDLLEIRNLEVKQLESKMKTIEDKVAGEKQRHDLMHKKLELMIRHNGELKREYETQLCLFAALREKYNEKEVAQGIIDELKKPEGVNGDVNGDVDGDVKDDAGPSSSKDL